MSDTARTRALTLVRSEAPFLVALLLGLLVRLLVQVAFAPGFVHSDSPGYLSLADDFQTSAAHPVGYGVLVWTLALVDRGVDAITVVQHLLGLATAVVLYALLRRWSVSPWIATAAVLPVLFDQMQLTLEHTVLSDVLFMLLVVLAVAALGWRRTPTLVEVAVAGLLLSMATLVRVVGEPALLAGLVFCAITAGTVLVRLRRALVLVVAFVLPVVAYAGWYHQERDAWALTEASGRSLYMRTTSFVDCSKVTLPDYERALCPREPIGQRLDPTQYGWNFRNVLPPLVLPPGVTRTEALHDFASRTMRAQPLAYARTVGRDIALGFWPRRVDAYGYSTTPKWSFHRYVTEPMSAKSKAAYAAHGGTQLSVRQPLAGFLDDYDEIAYLPGPLLLALLGLAVAGLVVRRVGAPPARPLIFLMIALGIGLVIVPDIVTEFVWRYQLPAIILIPPAAALAWTRLRAGSSEPA